MELPPKFDKEGNLILTGNEGKDFIGWVLVIVFVIVLILNIIRLIILY